MPAMIQGIFYARFLPHLGPKIAAQSPAGCVVPVPIGTKSGIEAAASAKAARANNKANGKKAKYVPPPPPPPSRPPLFDFDVVRFYIIPRQPFCNRLVTVNDPDDKYSIIGFPVLIRDERYHRNEFIFNFGLIVDREILDMAPFERVVRRLAATLGEMEKQTGYLSSEDYVRGDGAEAEVKAGGKHKSSRRTIEGLLDIIREDLNNYGECMIPVDQANTINMKLFPGHRPPPEVRGWHVPVAKMKLANIVDPNWDLTLQKVVAHIDGVSDVRRIAWAADVSLGLAKTALRHLLYYDTIFLLDMFFFSSCYAPRPGIHDFVANVGGIVDECAAYVCIHAGRPSPASNAHAGTASAGRPHSYMPQLGPLGEEHVRDVGGGSSGVPERPMSNFQIVKLMTSFCYGKSVMEWLRGHQEVGLDVLHHVDVRRLVQFGVVKGCLYRVHKYVVSEQYLASLVTGQSRPTEGGDPLQKYMDGLHSFDQIITEQNLTDAEAIDKIKSMRLPEGDWRVLYR